MSTGNALGGFIIFFKPNLLVTYIAHAPVREARHHSAEELPNPDICNGVGSVLCESPNGCFVRQLGEGHVLRNLILEDLVPARNTTRRAITDWQRPLLVFTIASSSSCTVHDASRSETRRQSFIQEDNLVYRLERSRVFENMLRRTSELMPLGYHLIWFKSIS